MSYTQGILLRMLAFDQSVAGSSGPLTDRHSRET
jgi:hypothetical protein